MSSTFCSVASIVYVHRRSDVCHLLHYLLPCPSGEHHLRFCLQHYPSSEHHLRCRPLLGPPGKRISRATSPRSAQGSVDCCGSAVYGLTCGIVLVDGAISCATCDIVLLASHLQHRLLHCPDCEQHLLLCHWHCLSGEHHLLHRFSLIVLIIAFGSASSGIVHCLSALYTILCTIRCTIHRGSSFRCSLSASSTRQAPLSVSPALSVGRLPSPAPPVVGVTLSSAFTSVACHRSALSIASPASSITAVPAPFSSQATSADVSNACAFPASPVVVRCLFRLLQCHSSREQPLDCPLQHSPSCDHPLRCHLQRHALQEHSLG
ncbi:uncharacterized protein LOC125694952 [Lagopus muta]|uniref:uncharacterized protein LOC125694952 n=1 Tax=Lagopus muta TaxID=64668 RepID=UPI0020A17544|nr:uncharacterized protein LOC125694952 [Lagopus muta]